MSAMSRLLACAFALLFLSTPLHAADLMALVQQGRTTELAHRLAKTPVSRVDAAQRARLLLTAVQGNRADLVEVLLHWGADPNVSIEFSVDGETVRLVPLNFVVTAKADWAVARALVAGGARADQPSDLGYPLLQALGMGRYDVANGLLDVGASPLVRDPTSGFTALFELVVSARDAQVDAALVLAQRLVKAGVDVNAASKRGPTALVFAVAAAEPRVVRWLIAAGARVDVTGSRGETLLQMASRKGNPEVVDALLKAGATP
jgi:ankyrin repeat protein